MCKYSIQKEKKHGEGTAYTRVTVEEEFITQHQVSEGVQPPFPIPICQPIWRLPGLTQIEVLGALVLPPGRHGL